MDFGQWSALVVLVGIALMVVSAGAQLLSIPKGWATWLQNFGAILLVVGAASCVLVAADLFTISFN